MCSTPSALSSSPLLHPDIIMNQNLVLNTTWDGLNPVNLSRLQESPLSHQNITYVNFYLHKPSVAAVFTVSYLLIFLVCMLGNGVVCFIVLRRKNMRTVTNLFILNLAISDLLVGIFCMPTTLVDNIITGQSTQFNMPSTSHNVTACFPSTLICFPLLTGWPFGSVVCKISGMVQGISVSASVFTLVAIAVDRWGKHTWIPWTRVSHQNNFYRSHD